MKTSHALDQAVPLAAELNDNKVTPGLLGFVVFAAIAIGLWLLMKSMGRQMKKIDFEEPPEHSPERIAAGVPAPASDPGPARPAPADSPSDAGLPSDFQAPPAR